MLQLRRSARALAMNERAKIWKPLDPAKREIRLFVLAPSRLVETYPHGRLITVSLDQQLHYEAISHAWGQPTYCEPLYLDGIQFPITSHLCEALRHLRHETREKCYWVDAFCINQYDLEDRSQQVQLMQHIFHRASSVRVWLGFGRSHLEKVVVQIRNEENIFEPGDQQGKEFLSVSPAKAQAEQHKSAQRQSLIQKNLESLYDLSQLPWFSRLWVIQEIALARHADFHYGFESFDMTKLELLLRRLDNFVVEVGRPTERSNIRYSILGRVNPIRRASSLFHTATISSHKKNVKALIHVLQGSRLAQVSDARDRIYGLLGLMTATFGMDFMQADYTQSLHDVYTNFARKLIVKTSSLAVLNQTEYNNNSTPGLPTWVPDWGSCFDAEPAIRRLYLWSHFRASGSGKDFPLPSGRATSRQLELSGFIFDTVDEVGGGCHYKTKVLPLIFEWQAMCDCHDDVFAKTLLMDHIMNKKPAKATWFQCYEAMTVDSSAKSPRQLEIVESLWVSLSRRRFFRTAKNRIAHGPMDTQKGDVLAILAGGNLPYVLRKDSRSESHSPGIYAFVGECYVNGVMEGELLKKDELRDVPKFEDIWLE